MTAANATVRQLIVAALDTGMRRGELLSLRFGDIDLRGILGISDEARNGFHNISVSFEIEGDAPAEKLNQLIEQARARSAVFDVLTNGVPVTVGVKTIQ